MKQQTFEHHYQSEWAALEQWMVQMESSAFRRSAAPFLNDFPQRYRRLCHHLALARARHYTPQLIERLNQLALRGHQHLYLRRDNLWQRLIRFLAWDFPTAIREESHLIALSALLFLGPMIVIALGIQLNPNLIYTLLDPKDVITMESMYAPDAGIWGRERESDSDFLMFGFYIRNNIGIAFQTYAGGVLLGLGTLFFLIFNGIYIGAVMGHLIHVGYHEPFFSFVSGHSALELGAIVLAGAMGLKLGGALLMPGRYRRFHALQRAARQSMTIVYGFVLMLLLAAFVEAFWSSKTQVDPLIKYSVGLLLGLVLWGWLVRLGRRIPPQDFADAG